MNGGLLAREMRWIRLSYLLGNANSSSQPRMRSFIQPVDPVQAGTAFDLQVGDFPAGTYLVLLRSEAATLHAAWVKGR